MEVTHRQVYRLLFSFLAEMPMKSDVSAFPARKISLNMWNFLLNEAKYLFVLYNLTDHDVRKCSAANKNVDGRYIACISNKNHQTICNYINII